LAEIVQVPAATGVKAPPVVIVQTPVVADVKATVRLELALAESVGDALISTVPGLENVIVWLAWVILNVWLACVAAA
jgi:hypothetical protein